MCPLGHDVWKLTLTNKSINKIRTTQVAMERSVWGSHLEKEYITKKHGAGQELDLQ